MRVPATVTILIGAAILVGACSGSGSGDGSGPGDEAGPADCDPARVVDVVPDEEQTLELDGVRRRYFVAVPDGYDGTRKVPLVFSFHGSGGWAEQHEENTRLARVGTERGYIVVTPDSIGDDPKEWNMLSAPDLAPDYEFVDALLTDVETRFCVDPDRVFATGFSNGSGFSGFLVCQEPYRFAAVAMVGGMSPSTCDPAVAAPPVLSLMGTADPVNEIFPAETMFEQYRTHYECATARPDEESTEVFTRSTLEDCALDTSITLLMLHDAFHVWPGGVTTAGTTKPGETFPATESIYDFFDASGG